MNWRKWWCNYRGFHIAKGPAFIEVSGSENIYAPVYVLMERRCKCGEIAKSKLRGGLGLVPGGTVEYEPTWPSVR